MSDSVDIFSIAAEFYENYPSIQPSFAEQQNWTDKVLAIIHSSVFLNNQQKQKMKKVVRFFGKNTLKTIANSLIRQNIRFLINEISVHEKKR